jgi:hypothetical protein
VKNRIQEIPTDRPFAVIMRHAERDDITDLRQAFEIPLNKNGFIAAEDLGQEIDKIDSINLFHSPVPRCKQTAESIVKGLDNKSRVVGPEAMLGGPYLKGDWMDVAREIARAGMLPFVRLWFDNKIGDKLMHPIEMVAEQKLDYLRSKLLENGSSIHVTHDWNILVLREYFFNLKHEDLGNPDFMDGIVCYFDDDKLILRYNDHIVKL